MQSKKSDEILQNHKYSNINVDKEIAINDNMIFNKCRKRFQNSLLKNEKSKSKIIKTSVNSSVLFNDYLKENVNKSSEISKDKYLINDDSVYNNKSGTIFSI